MVSDGCGLAAEDLDGGTPVACEDLVRGEFLAAAERMDGRAVIGGTDRDRQFLHDRLAGTRVVRVEA